MEIESKVCKKCGYDKPISEFSIKNKNRSQPYNSRCKSCINADRREKFASVPCTTISMGAAVSAVSTRTNLQGVFMWTTTMIPAT